MACNLTPTRGPRPHSGWRVREMAVGGGIQPTCRQAMSGSATGETADISRTCSPRPTATTHVQLYRCLNAQLPTENDGISFECKEHNNNYNNNELKQGAGSTGVHAYGNLHGLGVCGWIQQSINLSRPL